MKSDAKSASEQQLSAELAEAKEQLLHFFNRFGDIYCWDLARKAKAISITAMLTNFLICINAGFISSVRPEALSLNFEIAEWTYYFSGACALLYLVMSIISQISLSLGRGQKLVLGLVLTSLVFTISIFSSLIGFFDSLTWFIFFLYTMLGFVLLDWRQVVITDTAIVFCMMLISFFHEDMPFRVQAYLFSQENNLDSLTMLDLFTAWSITATSAFLGMWIMSFLLRNWHAHGIENVTLAHLDPLTKVMKRRAILDALENEVLSAAREKSPLTVAVIDLDKFKSLNSEFGHVFGDQMLVHFAQQLGRVTRREDLVGRYGGQEFIVIFPRCRSDIAVQVLERLRKHLLENPLTHNNKSVGLSFSAGVSYLRPGDQKYENVIARADRALCEVKSKGGKQILDDGDR